MKILYLISSLNIGGAEILLKETSACLAKGNKIEVIYFRGDGKLAGHFTPAVHITKAPSGWRGLCRIKRLISQFGPDVIHTHLLPADIYLLFLRKSRDIRYFTSIHNTGKGNVVRDWVANRLYKLIEMRFAGRHKFIFISNAVKNYMQAKAGIGKGNFVTMHNGVRIPDKINREQRKDRLRILFVGRLVRQKNPSWALEICRRLKARDISFSLTIVGDGYLRNDLEKMAQAEGLGQWISFVGEKAHVADYYLNSDLLLVTSSVEGFGLAAIEAMSYAVCVLARPVGGLTDIIEDSHSGYLCSRIDDFVERVVQLDSDSETLATVAQRSRLSAMENFDLMDKSRQLLSLYDG